MREIIVRVLLQVRIHFLLMRIAAVRQALCDIERAQREAERYLRDSRERLSDFSVEALRLRARLQEMK